MLAIDHLVIASHDPEKDAEELVEKDGIIAIEGGRHENWGTYNFLAFFKNDCYIEWLGVYDEELARKSENPLIRQTVEFLDQRNGGLVTYALRTQRMDEHIKRFDKQRLPYSGPYPGKRKKADGSTLSWRMLFPDETKELPFLIEWGSGVNQPADETKINPRDLEMIKVPGNPGVYRNIFQLEDEEDNIQLENGKLILTNSGNLDFTISDW